MGNINLWVLGLLYSPYYTGETKFTQQIHELIDIKNDGSFRLDQSYFNYSTGLTMTNEKFNKLFGKKEGISKQIN